MDISPNWATLWTALAAVAASVSAIFAAIYTRLTYRMVRATSTPNVVVYSHHDSSRSSIIDIVIANIGHAVATDIVFRTNRDIPYRAFGAGAADEGPSQRMTSGPLINGIPLLAPGEKRVLTWGQFGGLTKAIGDRYITVTAVYSHAGSSIESISRLEVESFDGTDASDSAEQLQLREMKRIGDQSQKLTRAVESLAVSAKHLVDSAASRGDLTRVAADIATGGR
jgi:hypothetical protein